MFLKKCKFIIKSRSEYLDFSNHCFENFPGLIGLVGMQTDVYPLYIMIEDSNTIEHSYERAHYNTFNNKVVTVDAFLKMKYVVSQHFTNRFKERFEDCSDTRFKKLVKDIFNRGTWLKRKDSIQILKYNKTSTYVLHSRFEKTEKVYYLIVLTNANILTTIYEFDIKDMKFFKEI